jgi:hypothetical protein
MKPAISLGLMLLLTSCATPQQHTGIHTSTTVRRPHDTLQPRLAAVPDVSGRSARKAHAGDALTGDFRTYGLVETPAPIASREAPHAYYQPPVPPRRVINQVTNGLAEGGGTALPPSADVTPSGSYRSVINQITNQPLPDGEPTRAPHGSNETVISGVTNAPVPTSPAPIVPPKPHVQRTVIEPIGNSPVQ